MTLGILLAVPALGWTQTVVRAAGGEEVSALAEWLTLLASLDWARDATLSGVEWVALAGVGVLLGAGLLEIAVLGAAVMGQVLPWSRWHLWLWGWRLRALVQRRRTTPDQAQRVRRIQRLHERADHAVLVDEEHPSSLLSSDLYFQTDSESAVRLLTALQQQGFLGPGKRFGDLGSGTGVMVHLANALTGAEGAGIESNARRSRYARQLTPVLAALGAVDASRIHWIDGDFLTDEVDLSAYDVLYLWPSQPLASDRISRLLAKMTPGALLVVRGPGPLEVPGTEWLDFGTTAGGPFAGSHFIGYRRSSVLPVPSTSEAIEDAVRAAQERELAKAI